MCVLWVMLYKTLLYNEFCGWLITGTDFSVMPELSDGNVTLVGNNAAKKAIDSGVEAESLDCGYS